MGVIHPTNELLGSDIIPRWAVIGWLLTTCTNQVASSNAKLALFYDWLFFNPDKDNIMNIEPAILVMHHSMRPHPAITATLLDFLCRIIGNFFFKEKDKVHQGITNSLRTILDKRVLPSLQPLFDNPRLDEELRSMLRERFPHFITGAPQQQQQQQHHHQQQQPSQQQQQQQPPVLDREDGVGGATAEKENEAAFSDDDDDDEKPLSISKGGKKKTKIRKEEEEDDEQESEEIGENVKELLSELKSEKAVERRCECVDSIVKEAVSEEYGFEQCSMLAQQLAESLADEFEGRVFPDSGDNKGPTKEEIEDSVGRPIFVVFRSLCEMTDADPNRNVLLQVLAELYALQPRVGYYLLYFLSADKSVHRTAKEKAATYRDLCESIDDKYSLDICLVNDMRQCQEDDVSLFVHLVPEIFVNFSRPSIGNTDLLYLVVSCVDGRQVQTLICHILARDFVMFKKDSFSAVLSSSLGWETFEQYVLWQLAAAHDLPIDCMAPTLPKMDSSKHAEAITAVLLRLKHEKPTADLLKSLLSRDPSSPSDKTVSSALIHWMGEYEDKLGDLVSAYLHKQVSQGGGGGQGGAGSKRKRDGGGSKSISHAAETTLTHLDI